MCRTDIDWMETQRQNIAEIIDIANRHHATMLCNGDALDIPRTPPNVLTMLLRELERLETELYLIGGNHSIQYHKQEFLYESSLGILASLPDNKTIHYLECMDNSEDGRFEHITEFTKGIAMCHTLTVKTDKDIMFGMKAISAQKLLDKYPEYKYILTGDNHTAFTYEKNGRYVINPGSLNIQTADHKDYEPCVYLLDTEADTVKCIKLTHFHENVSNEHIQEKKDRDTRIESFVETIKRNGEVQLDFESKLYQMAKDQDDSVMDILQEIKQEVL
jgi:DNA repair exonuclease SbcCD nuclease subunit